MLLQCTRSKAAAAAIRTSRHPIRTLFPAIASTSRTRAHVSSAAYSSKNATVTASAADSIPDDIDAPLPNDGRNYTDRKDAEMSSLSFEVQKQRLLTSMDMLYQVQDAPAEKADTTPLDDQEAQYWARRMDSAMRDLEQEQRTRLRVAGNMMGREKERRPQQHGA